MADYYKVKCTCGSKFESANHDQHDKWKLLHESCVKAHQNYLIAKTDSLDQNTLHLKNDNDEHNRRGMR